MDDAEFYDWFVERVHTFADMGIMHPNSEQGKIVRICAVTMEERFNQLTRRIDELESELKELKESKEDDEHIRPPSGRGWSV